MSLPNIFSCSNDWAVDTENDVIWDSISFDVDSVDNKIADIIMININDGTVEGLQYKNFKGLSVQFTPKGDAGSSTGFIIRDFFKMMDGEENE